MNQKWTLVLAVSAGFLGGALSHVSLVSVHAQPPNAVPKEIRAQSFVLVDPSDHAMGTFVVEPLSPQYVNGKPVVEPHIVLRDSSGREIWRAGGSALRPLMTER